MKVLCVCLGNICRSPTAEVVLRDIAAREAPGLRLVVDSAGTGDYHLGDPPDHRAIAAAARRGYDLTPLRARQVDREDFERFDLLLAMDSRNLADLRVIAPTGTDRARLYLDWLATGTRPGVPPEVPDPYFGGSDGFERVLDLVESGARALVAALVRGDIGPRGGSSVGRVG